MLTSEPSSSILQILELSIWPILIIAVVLILRNSINKIMNRFSSADDLKMSVGSLSIQAKAMRELNQSIDLGFNDTTLKKSQIEALIDAKIRSIQAAIDFEITALIPEALNQKKFSSPLKMARISPGKPWT